MVSLVCLPLYGHLLCTHVCAMDDACLQEPIHVCNVIDVPLLPFDPVFMNLGILFVHMW